MMKTENAGSMQKKGFYENGQRGQKEIDDTVSKGLNQSPRGSSILGEIENKGQG